MNLSKSAIIFSMIMMVTATAEAASENRAVEININGIGPAVDEAAFTTVKQIVGAAIGNGIVDKFVVYGYGFEGGFSACAQASPRSQGFAPFIRQLRSVQPNPETTAYSIHRVDACNHDINTICTQDVFQCPDGSHVGRVAPSCEFAPCPGN